MSVTAKDPPGSFVRRTIKSIWYFIVLILRHGLYAFYVEFFKRPILFELPERTGEVAVITGGARGIGLETVKKLLECDFTVILGIRNPSAGEDAILKIRQDGIKSGKTLVLPLDLTSLHSVRKFADKVLHEARRIDVLINNAGIMFPPYEETVDGYESQFQVNYLSHFLLTKLLLPRMKETSLKKEIACRIVNVSSMANYGGSLDFTDLEKCKVYSASKSYQDSKLAQVLHAKYLNKKLRLENVNVKAYSLHPGMIPMTAILRHSGNLLNMFLPLISFLFRTPADGAQTVVYTALSPNLENEGGAFINSCKVFKPNPTAEDESLQKLLWERSLQLIHPNYHKHDE